MVKMDIYRWIVFSTALLQVGFELNAKEKVDVLAVEYPPFTTHTHSSKGVAFDLLNKLTASSEIQWVPIILPPARVVDMLEKGDWCATFFTGYTSSPIDSVTLSERNVDIGLIRKQTGSEFKWNSLKDLRGKTMALLRSKSKDDTEFTKKLNDSGITPVFVETADAAIKMVLFNRTDFALIDNYTFTKLQSNAKKQLQFSVSLIQSKPITLYLNRNCDIDVFSAFK